MKLFIKHLTGKNAFNTVILLTPMVGFKYKQEVNKTMNFYYTYVS